MKTRTTVCAITLAMAGMLLGGSSALACPMERPSTPITPSALRTTVPQALQHARPAHLMKRRGQTLRSLPVPGRAVPMGYPRPVSGFVTVQS